MDTIQAAILLEILEVFPDEVVKRQVIGERYSSNLTDLKLHLLLETTHQSSLSIQFSAITD